MFVSVLLNGTLGFAMSVAILFCSGDLEAAFESPTGFPFMAIFLNATNSVGGATGMVSLASRYSLPHQC